MERNVAHVDFIDLSKKHKRYGSIDALRFFAMSAVIAQHCNLFPLGWIGVWLFFTISGFVVTSSIFDRRKSTFFHDIIAFYQRRLFRIFPAYVVFIAVAMALYTFWNIHPFWKIFESLFACYFNIYRIQHDTWVQSFPIDHLWSISTEMQFYALFGFILYLLPKENLVIALIIMAVTSIISRVCCSLFFLPTMGSSFTGKIQSFIVFNQLDSFAAGALLALYRDKITIKLSIFLLKLGFALLSIYVASYAAVNFIQSGHMGPSILKGILSGDNVGQLREAFVYIPLVILSSGLVAAAYCEILDVLKMPFIRRAGKISYSGYIWHFLVIAVLSHFLSKSLGFSLNKNLLSLLPKFLLFLLSLPLTLLLAQVSYLIIERPCVRFGAKFDSDILRAPV